MHRPLLPGYASSEAPAPHSTTNPYDKMAQVGTISISTNPYYYTRVSNDEMVAMRMKIIEAGNARGSDYSYPALATTELSDYHFVMMPAHEPFDNTGAPSAWWIVAKRPSPSDHAALIGSMWHRLPV